MQKYIGKFSLILLILFLCAFNKNDYKIEVIKNDDMDFRFYIPKDFCRFELKSSDEFMLKINGDTKIYDTYMYVKCSEVEKINSNEDFDEEEVISILLLKKAIISALNNKNFTNLNRKINMSLTELNKLLIRSKLLAFDTDSELEKTNISERDKRFIKHNIEQLTSYLSENTKTNGDIIDGNYIVNTQFDFKNKINIINSSATLINGMAVTINYESRGSNFPLANPKDFAEYVKETQILNQPQINTYFTTGNQILNIKAPDPEKFLDASFAKSLKNTGYDKIFFEYMTDGGTRIFIGVKVLSSNMTYEKLFKDVKNMYPNSDVEMVNDVKYPYIKLPRKLDGKESVRYYYIVQINDFKVSIVADLFEQKNDITPAESKRIRRVAEKYIEFLKKVNNGR